MPPEDRTHEDKGTLRRHDDTDQTDAVQSRPSRTLSPRQSIDSGRTTTAVTERKSRAGASSRKFRSALTAAPCTEPTPLPQRPKGRWFIGLFMFGVGTFAALAVWNSFFRYSAYGMITGRQIDVSVPWEGVVKSFHVKEGDDVRQGDVLVTIENLELNHQFDRVRDELQIAQVKLHADMSQIRWRSQAREEVAQKALADYYETWGELLEQQAKLEELNSKLGRFAEANKRYARVVSPEEVESVKFQRDGLVAKIEKLKLAVEGLKKLKQTKTQPDEEIAKQFKPQLARIESLKTDLLRLRERLEQGKIRAPANGRVVRIHSFTGERAAPSNSIVEIVEDGSLEATVYLSQSRSNLLKKGDEVRLWIKPRSEVQEFRVSEIGETMERAPESLSRHYRKDEELLPVHLVPVSRDSESAEMRLGSEVVLLNSASTQTFLTTRD